MFRKLVWPLLFALALALLPLAGCAAGEKTPGVKSGPADPEYRGQPQLQPPGKGGEGGDKPRVCFTGPGPVAAHGRPAGFEILL
ncbi:MAG: hypothetical protein IMW93_03460 [Thermoanaerobacteraceae bacterium]|nr:hypothetical protein [Thermoanaerobacteraceae bacterium]